MKKVNLEELKSLSLDEVLEKCSLEELEKLLPMEDILAKFPDIREDPKAEPGVLLSAEIKRCVEEFRLICPFDPNNLKAASYRLTVGDEYALGGEKGKLYDKPDKNQIRIPPFEVAIVKTKEIINMPRFLIGRWNIRVTIAYQGLLWVGGPQVDPGWVGHLFCPIYNLSNEGAVLEKGKPLAIIGFIRTTTFKEERKDGVKMFPRPPDRKNLDDYHWRLKSALLTGVGERIDKIESKVNRVESLIALVFTCIAVLFAALSIFVTFRGTSQPAPLPISLVIRWVALSVILSIIAIAISLFARVKLEIKKRWLKTTVSIFYIAYVLVSAIAIVALGLKVLWQK